MGNKNNLTSVDPETKHCRSEPFDEINEEFLIYQVVMRFFVVPSYAGLLRMTDDARVPDGYQRTGGES